jgi:alpha-mannosidase
MPDARCSTLGAHAEEILAANDRLPIHQGELNTIFEGCYTTHAEAKAGNRRAENGLATAETLAALAGLDERDRLSHAWRRVLFNQFHDILCGSSVHEAYEENARDIAFAEEIANAVSAEALAVIEARADGGDIVVTNALGWDREEVVVAPAGRGRREAVRLESADGSSTPGQWTSDGLVFVARAPAFGTVSYSVQEEDKEAPSIEVVEGPLYITVETDAFTIRIHRPSGAIVSLQDKRVGRELVGFGTRRGSDYLDSSRVDLALNVMQVLDERFHAMSAWHLDDVTAETSLIDGAACEVVENGPVRAVIAVKREFRQSRLEQLIVFYKQLPRIDFEALIDWREPSGREQGIPNLKVAFNARLAETEAWYETPYGAARRPADGQEVPAFRWADVGGADYGIALLNDSRHGHDALGSRLRLTLVRSAFDPDPESDMGRHRVRYSLVPHAEDWRRAGITRLAAGFNQPLIARAAPDGRRTDRTWSPRLVGSPGILLAALKRAQHGPDLVLRLQESFGEVGEAVVEGLPQGSRAHNATITEEVVDDIPVDEGHFRLQMRPWQVATVLVTG